MFAIAVPSTITFLSPDGDEGDHEVAATLTFSHPTDDVSKCQLTLTTPDGHIHEAVFDTQGGVREQRVTTAEEIEARREEEQEKIEAQRDREQLAADEQSQRELSTADDTTANDLANDAPQREAPSDPNIHHAHDPFGDLRQLAPEPQHGGQ